ncbi:MAG: NAD(P)H-dependent oxidoreductase [Thermoplasmatales archaeon]|nr:NAD(P)H-dependent oxidoreductase [Thermoplasmatales archaeon]
MNIFYSWQSDNPQSTNKKFIEECLREVINDLDRTVDITGRNEELHTLNKDTQGVPGYPAIVDTIIKKISDADCFVADLSFVAKTAKKGIPNPNVMYELGYAVYCLGYKRVIAVMNTYYGEPEDLPFDIVQRRFPVQYCLAPDTTKVERAKIKERFKKDLNKAMAYCLALPPKESLPSLRSPVSYKTIYDHILVSKLEDWSEQYEIETGVFQVYYQKDPQLRVVLDETKNGILIEDYKSPWANCFLHPNATSYMAKIFYNTTLIDEIIIVAVDEGTAKMPQPISDSEERHFTIEPLAYKIAQLFDSMNNLDEYIWRANALIQKDGMSLRIGFFTEGAMELGDD